MKRLTMHLKGVEKYEVTNRKGEKSKMIRNTLSVPVQDEDEARSRVAMINENKKSKARVFKWYLSNFTV